MYGDKLPPAWSGPSGRPTAAGKSNRPLTGPWHRAKERTKEVHGILEISSRPRGRAAPGGQGGDLQQQMRQAAAELDFETAAKLRDQLFALTGQTQEKKIAPGMPGSRRKARGRTRK